LKALIFSWHAFITTQANQINMNLATLIGKIKQEITLWSSSTHEKESSKPIGFFAKTCRSSSKYCKNNNTNQSGRNFTSNSKSKYNLNVTCHYCGRKGHIIPKCKDKARDHANGVFKSQANTSSIEIIQLFMAIVANENNYTYIWYLDTCATKHLTP
jgi:hypothetical protein